MHRTGGRPRRWRRAPAVTTAAALCAGSMVALAPPASAVTVVTTFAGLADAMTDCIDDVVQLGGDIDEPDVLVVECTDVVLDLHGWELAVQSLRLQDAGAPPALTISDSVGGGLLRADSSGQPDQAGIDTSAGALTIEADVQALGGSNAAGIGGGNLSGSGPIAITGGEVTATGGLQGAGIGGGARGSGDVTITGGVVTATGGNQGAGIGGGRSAGSAVRITGGQVTATGGQSGAGIGGGDFGGGGTIEISGGEVAAQSGFGAAGIGGGAEGPGGTVTITGGTVTATGNMDGAGIGGGHLGDGADVTIGAGATVTASIGGTFDPARASAIGRGASGGPLGSLEIAGTLHLPDSDLLVGVTDNPVRVLPGGRVLGAPGDVTTGGRFRGDGLVINQGTIALDEAFVLADDVTVEGHHYLVHFETADGATAAPSVRVFAESFDAGHRALPDGPVVPGATFLGWSTDPGGSATFTATTTLNPLSTGQPTELTVYATYDVPSDDDDDAAAPVPGAPDPGAPPADTGTEDDAAGDDDGRPDPDDVLPATGPGAYLALLGLLAVVLVAVGGAASARSRT